LAALGASHLNGHGPSPAEPREDRQSAAPVKADNTKIPPPNNNFPRLPARCPLSGAQKPTSFTMSSLNWLKPRSTSRYLRQPSPTIRANLYELLKDSDGKPTQGVREVYAEQKKLLEQYQAQWQALRDKEIADLNALARKRELPALVVPAAPERKPAPTAA